MIQFLKSYEHNRNGKITKYVMGQKVNIDPDLAKELVKRGVAKETTWNGKVEKMKTNLFKPKEDNNG